MKKNPVLLFHALLFSVFLLAGCSNEIDKAIQQLGGSEAEQEEAMGVIQVSAQDPMPSLLKAIKNKKLSPLARKNVAMLIGSTAAKSGDDSAVPTLVSAMEKSEEDVQLAIIDALEKIPGSNSQEALLGLLDHENDKLAQRVWTVLDSKAKAKEAEADALQGEAALPRKIELMEQAASINPRNQRIIEKLAGMYALQGDTRKAKELYNAGGKFVYKIRVIGPFSLRDQTDFFDPKNYDTAAPAVLPDGTQLEWMDFTKIPENGVVDFRRDRSTKIPRSTFYVAFNIDSKKNQDALLNLSSGSSEIKLWVNGEMMLEGTVKELAVKKEHSIKITLKEGRNAVIMKLRSARYPRFSIRVSDLKHKKLDSIDYSL